MPQVYELFQAVILERETCGNTLAVASRYRTKFSWAIGLECSDYAPAVFPAATQGYAPWARGSSGCAHYKEAP